jgi:hypothetical protein
MPKICKNPTSEELEQLASNGEVRAIFDITDVYVWDPTTASYDEVFKILDLVETATYAIINVDRKTVRVVEVRKCR